jgi:hypothetical protein
MIRMDSEQFRHIELKTAGDLYCANKKRLRQEYGIEISYKHTNYSFSRPGHPIVIAEYGVAWNQGITVTCLVGKLGDTYLVVSSNPRQSNVRPVNEALSTLCKRFTYGSCPVLKRLKIAKEDVLVLTVRHRTHIFDLFASAITNGLAADNSNLLTLSGQKIYTKKEIDELKLYPYSHEHNDQKFPILENLGGSFVFYEHNFKAFKDEIIKEKAE